MLQSLKTVTLALTAGIANGCASFNDTIVVDVGDQFRLLQMEMAEVDDNGRPVDAPRGFECAFHANNVQRRAVRRRTGSQRHAAVRAD